MQLKYRNTKKGIKYMLIMLLVFIVVFVSIYISQSTALKRSLSEQIKTDINAYAVNIDNEIAHVGSNILLMDDIITNRGVLIKEGETISFSSIEEQMELEMDLVNWMQTHKIYDQIRIIGLDGVEVLRVNNQDGVPYIVSNEDLQDKSNRYYFENAVVLDDNSIYLSKIDLNIENGEIEYINGEPKEMLRIGTTLYNSNNEKIGLLIVNYYVDNLFHDLETYKSEYTFFEIINEEGFYLHHKDKSLEYGFMYEDKQGSNIQDNTDVDFNTSGNEEGYIYQENIGNSQYTYLIVSNYKMENAITDLVERDIEIHSDNGDLLILGYLDFNNTDIVISQRNNYIFIFILFIGLIIFISRLLDELFYSNKQRLEMLEHTANHDSLTGLLNRKGVFSVLEHLSKNQREYAILFLDLDGFKAINDKYGHNIGDKLLIETGRRLQSVLRDTDVVSRLGGDEFLIILKDMNNINDVEKVKRKIQDEICKTYNLDGYDCSVSVSIGEAIQDGDITIDSLIHKADQLMYHKKAQLSHNLRG